MDLKKLFIMMILSANTAVLVANEDPTEEPTKEDGQEVVRGDEAVVVAAPDSEQVD